MYTVVLNIFVNNFKFDERGAAIVIAVIKIVEIKIIRITKVVVVTFSAIEEETFCFNQYKRQEVSYINVCYIVAIYQSNERTSHAPIRPCNKCY